MGREADVARISDALTIARTVLRGFVPGRTEVSRKSGGDPVTEADRAVDRALREALVRDGEGWLSEETEDDLARLRSGRVWVVDPLDGTKEFVRGIPEWCVSVGLVEDGAAVAGGVCNPATGDTIVGAEGLGLVGGHGSGDIRRRGTLNGATVLASRSEVDRGEWGRFSGMAFHVRPMGSVAYKLALVASGRAEATWTLVPKHEWDVAAGVALVLAAGGSVFGLDGTLPSFNREVPKLDGLVAVAAGLSTEVRTLLGIPFPSD